MHKFTTLVNNTPEPPNRPTNNSKMFFNTVMVPTVLQTCEAPLSVQRREYRHSWQRNLVQRMFLSQEEMVTEIVEPRALRRQLEPTVRISLRRRVTDVLNSPFNYEMTEAARVVL